MPRLTQLDDLLFPIEERPVFAAANGGDQKLLRVPDKKAIVDTKRQRVLGIVSRGYRLVTNREALDWGYQCCRIMFPETEASEWGVKTTDAPATAGHCSIDLVHNSTALDFSVVPAENRPDVFGPFIRITNSYNGLRALAFDIGFYRKVCKNGMILPNTIIRFKFTHLSREIGEAIKFDVSHERLTELKANVRTYFDALRTCQVRRDDHEPFVRGVLYISMPKTLKPESHESTDWDALTTHIADLCNRYARGLGENAYAVFNAVTEFASHPPANRHVHRDRNSLQRLAGAWLSKFAHDCPQPTFNLTTYLAELSAPKSDPLGT